MELLFLVVKERAFFTLEFLNLYNLAIFLSFLACSIKRSDFTARVVIPFTFGSPGTSCAWAMIPKKVRAIRVTIVFMVFCLL